ncbi:stage II sporulation protein R [Natranaerovirga hydrolytica]|uniref:Stage II sporulation protein R n=1 Tax=Natranaerovirga hydrolytica TaxID=680378 RepID=A0A4V6NFD5_9FIRM|nr:stage II sporulation protein R [Natranaerovirga hydrolytica]TCK93291.1 stage II sporulation protein R [Natranaerovirga hydrolytica]
MKMNRKKIIKELSIVMVAIAIGFVTLIVIHEAKESSAQKAQEAIASELIRFHVLANSDSAEDQELKNKVRDAVLEEMDEMLATSESIEETRAIVTEKKNYIQSIAKDIITENHKDYTVEVTLEKENFPTKVYGDMVFPTGEYEALRILIGEAKGKNWWCVMFPPLCFVDVTHNVVQEDNTIPNENLTMAEEKEMPVKVKFRLFDLLGQSNERHSEKRTGAFAYIFR